MTATSAMPQRGLALVPTPRLVRDSGRRLTMPYIGRIVETAEAGRLDPTCVLASQLADDIEQATGLRWDTAKGDSWQGFIRLEVIRESSGGGDDAPVMGERAYRLDIAEDGVTVLGGGLPGLRDGVQTLRQIIRQSAPALPAVHIEDEPAFAVRGYYLDATRGRVPTLDWLKQWADLLCLAKYNQLQLYVEHSFAFDHMSETWRGVCPLTPAQIIEFDAYCAERGIELVPSVSTFGHHYMALRTRELRDLGEFPEQADRAYSFIERMEHHTLNITDERAFDFSCSLVDSYVELFRSRKFNICADETFDLGKGRGRGEAERRGVAAMYADYVTRLCRHLSERGYKPQFWGDIAVEMPQILDSLPDDVTLLNWIYEPEAVDEKVRLVARSGARQIVCPAVWGWNSLLARPHDAWRNISRMARYGWRHGADGMLVTDWGDFGHINDPRMSIPSMMVGAQYAWDPETLGDADDSEAVARMEAELNRRIALAAYGDAGGRLVEAWSDAARQVAFGWHELVGIVELDDGRGGLNEDVQAVMASRCEGVYRERVAAASTVRQAREASMAALEGRLDAAEAMNAALAGDRQTIAEAIAGASGDRAALAQSLMLACEGQMLLNDIGAHLASVWRDADGEADDAESAKRGRLLAARWETWFEIYCRVWRSISEESELRRIADVVWRTADLLR
ncbi:glycoside hydrolase family 20 zincin-like fold domain-containing protein [Bifidobacterium eulemuris]|uniref:beta-N-acetylhexosaminidase n=1 Tax=Bifidobacterium eulemuris TaxID=1765219 RepID=A0A261G7K6_9BIFI|nr:glycoside hydrolase family 20 zincin-like fold domain-containing protein [Bifidobacterium eulemuris]OZG67402.1 glycosyl hydrolase [Bifidobacterium eulemuris]QOL32971.1 family 20 glycosylhydrolase [Bifidobacterium eulemuris]